MPDGKDKLKKLHSNLVKDGYELPDYSTFEKDMSDSNKLFKLRENLVKDGYELPDQNTFRNDMGFGEVKKKVVASNDGGILGGVTQSTSNPQLKSEKEGFKDAGIFGKRKAEERNPLYLADEYKDLIGKKKTISTGGGSSFGLGTTGFQEVQDDEAKAKADKIKMDLLKRGYNVEKLVKDTEGLPKEFFDNDNTSKEALFWLMKQNPIKYNDIVNSAKTVYAIAKQSDAATANQFNHLNNIQYGGLENFIEGKRDQQAIIDRTLVGNERDEAHNRLMENSSKFINAANPDLIKEYQQSPLSSKVDINQYAGLKTLEIFKPEQYQQAIDIIGKDIIPQYNVPVSVGVNAPAAASQQWLTSDSLLAKKSGGVLSTETVNQRVGKESLLRQLSDLGRNNAITGLTKDQYELNSAFEQATTPEEQEQIKQQYVQNQAQINAIREEAKNDKNKFPLTEKLKLDKLAKEVTQQPGVSVGGYATVKFLKGFGNTNNSIEDLAIGLFGSKDDKTNLQMQRLGEMQDWENDIYLPESLKTEQSPYILQASKPLKDKVKTFLNGRSIGDLSRGEKDKLNKIISDNEGEIETITNPELGKSKNFLTKATMYQNAGFLGDIGSLVAQTYGLGALGAGKLVTTMTPMFTTSYSDYFNQAVAEGKPMNKASEYAFTHASIMALAGLINPKLDVVKRAVGMNTAAGKLLANISEDSWKEITSKGSKWINKFKDAGTGVAKEAAKMTAVYGVGTSIANDLADKALFDKNISADEMAEHAVTAGKDMLFGSAGLLGINFLTHTIKGKKVSPLEKASFFELADNPDLGHLKIDEAVAKGDITKEQGEQRKAAITEVSALVDKIPPLNKDGKPMTDAQRVDYLYNEFVKTKAKEVKKDLPKAQVEEVEQKELEADHANNIIYTDLSLDELEKRQTKIEKELEPKKDSDGKAIELPEKESNDLKAELNAVKEAIQNKPKESNVVGEPENISQPIELSVDSGNKLTKEAEDLIASIGDGSMPTFITKNLEKIAADNGIEIKGDMTAVDVVNALKEKQQPLSPNKEQTPSSVGGEVEGTAKALESAAKKNPTILNKISNFLGFNRKYYKGKHTNEGGDGGYHQSGTKDVMVNENGANEEHTFYLKGIEPDTKRGGKGSHTIESKQGDAIYYHEVGHKMFSEFSKLGHKILDKLKEYSKTDKFGHPTGYSAVADNLFDATMMDFYAFYKLHPEKLKESQPKAYDLMKEWEQGYISESYHKAKADGSNPELVKAVEQSLKEQSTSNTEVTKEEKVYSGNGLERAEAKKIYKQVREVDTPLSAEQIALEYIANGGKVSENAINEIAGSVKRASLNTGKRELKSNEVKLRDYADKKSESLDQLAHNLWELHDQRIPESEIKDALMDVVNTHNTRLEAAKEYLETYSIEYREQKEMEKYYKEHLEEVAAEEKAINEWLESETELENEAFRDENYVTKLIEKYETESKGEDKQPTPETESGTNQGIGNKESNGKEQTKEQVDFTDKGGNKVVDDKGEPLEVYHGTKEDFKEFDESKIGSTDSGWWGKGFYFHTDPNRGGYGDVVKSVNVNIKNPIDLPVNKSGEYLYDIIGEKAGLDKSFRDKSAMAIIKEIGSDNFTKLIKELGYDGIIVNYAEGTKEVVVFNKNQIKILPKETIKAEPLNNETKEQVVSTTETTKQKQLADKVRSLKVNLSKLSDGGLQSNPLGLPVAVWNSAMDIVAKTIEVGGDVVDALKKGLKYIQSNHRGQWDKKGFNDQVMKELGVRGITVNGQDLLVKSDAKTEKEYAQTVDGWYSDLEQSVLDTKGDKGSVESWKKALGNSEEAKWTGLNDWLSKQKGQVSKADIQKYLKDNRISVVEIVKGGENDDLMNRAQKAEKKFDVNITIDENPMDGSPDVKISGEKLDDMTDDEIQELQNEVNDFVMAAAPETKFSQYQLEGEKENYKEVLVTMPNENPLQQKVLELEKIYENDGSNYNLRELENAKKQLEDDNTMSFRSSHYEEPNILVHLRMNTRVDAEGNKVMFLEEVQSDWGQQGKKEGFKGAIEPKFKVERVEGGVKLYADGKLIDQSTNDRFKSLFSNDEEYYINSFRDAVKNMKERDAVSSAPFVTDTNAWTKLGLKVALKEAVKQGADKIAWTTGEQQNERYDLSKQINAASASKNNDGTYQLIVEDKQGQEIEPYSRSGKKVTPQEMEGIVGKDLTQKLIEGADRNKGREWKKNMKENPEFHTVRGVDLKIGGKGMKGFYGSPTEGTLGIVGNVVKSLTKQEPKVTEIKVTEDKFVYDHHNTTVEETPKAYILKDNDGNSLASFSKEVGSNYPPGQVRKQKLLEIARQNPDLREKVTGNSTQHSIDITPELKAEVQGGLPLFKDIKGRGKEIADLLRKGKIKSNGLQSNVAGIPIAIYNAAIETIAKALEAGATLTQAISKAYKEHKLSERKDFKSEEFIKKLEDATGEKFIEEEKKSSTPPPTTPPKNKSVEGEGGEGEWESIRKEKLKEIAGIKEEFEKRLPKSWKQIYDNALLSLSKMYPNKSIYDAMRTRVGEFIVKLSNNELFNPTSEDIAVFNLLKAETQKRINDISGMDSDNSIIRQSALFEFEPLENDLRNIARVTNPNGEAGRAFNMHQSEIMLDANYGLKIKRMRLMKANGGEKLTQEEEKWVSDKWEQEKELIKKEQEVRFSKMQEDFDAKIADLQKEYESKTVDNAPKGKLTKDSILNKKGDKSFADKIRKIKMSGTKVDFTFGTWNFFVESVARIVETGKTIKEAIEKLIEEGKIGFKTSKDRIDAESLLVEKLMKPTIEESIEKIKEFANENNLTDITNDMVKDNLIRDYINSHIGEVEQKDLLNEAFDKLKKELPSISKERLLEAYLKENEFKQPTKKDIEGSLAESKKQLKNITKLTEDIEDLDGLKQIRQRVFHNERAKSEYEKELFDKKTAKIKEINDRNNKIKEDNKKLESERIRQLSKVEDLSKKKAKIEQGIIEKTAAKDKKLDTPEIEKLKNEIKQLESDIRAAESEAKRISKEIQEKKDKIAELDANIERAKNDRDLIKTHRNKTVAEIDEEISAKQKELKSAIKDNTSEERVQADKLAKEKENTIKKIKEFQRKLDEGEFGEQLPVKLNKYDAELIKLKKQQSIIEEQYRKKEKELNEKNKSALERMADFARSAYVAILIGSPKTLFKVASMSIMRPLSEGISKVTFGKMYNLFFPNISKAALRGGESSSINSMMKGYQAYFAQMGQKGIERMAQRANIEYELALQKYIDYKKSGGTDKATLSKLKDEVNQKLIKVQGSFIYQFIGGSSIKDALKALVNRSNEIEKQFGRVEGESIKDGNYLDKFNYILGFIGRSHSAAKTFSGRFSFAAGFMARLEGAVKSGVDITNSDRILEIAHESYLDWERGKYQQSNQISDLWNKITNNISEGEVGTKREGAAKVMATLLRTEVAITRVPVNILHEAIVEYTLGAFKAAIMGSKEYFAAKKEIKDSGIAINTPEFKKALRDRISQMDEKQAATIVRCFRKGGLGIGLYALTLILGNMYFGGFPHFGQRRKKDESELENGELNPGDLVIGDTKISHSISPIIEHIPALWTTFMGLGMANEYNRSKKEGNTDMKAIWDATYTHLKIIEGGIPQSKIISPIRVINTVIQSVKKKASDAGIINKSNGYNNEQSKSPKYKIFIDNGVDIPEMNDDLSIKDEKNFKEFKLKEMPSDKLNEFSIERAKNIDRMVDELDKSKEVYKDGYGHVSINWSNDAELVRIQSLSKTQLKELMSEITKKANIEAKGKVFNDFTDFPKEDEKNN